MNKYDYYSAMFADIENYIKENEIVLRDTDYDTLYDKMFVDDSITGNASGSYTFNRWQASENLCYNEDLLCDAFEEFYGQDVPLSMLRDPEGCDVTIRCYLLSSVLNAVIDSITEDVEFSFEKYLENPSRKVVTRNGEPVIIIGRSPYDTIVGFSGEDQCPDLWDLNGKYLINKDSDFDLFFA